MGQDGHDTWVSSIIQEHSVGTQNWQAIGAPDESYVQYLTNLVGRSSVLMSNCRLWLQTSHMLSQRAWHSPEVMNKATPSRKRTTGQSISASRALVPGMTIATKKPLNTTRRHEHVESGCPPLVNLRGSARANLDRCFVSVYTKGTFHSSTPWGLSPM